LERLELVVKNDSLSLVLFDQLCEFLNFAIPDLEAWVSMPGLLNLANDNVSGRISEALKLVET